MITRVISTRGARTSGSDERPQRNLLESIRERAFAQIDIASLVFFRIAFGLVMVWGILLLSHQIEPFWIRPRLLFKYYGFSWVHPWPGSGLYIHWAALGALALFIAAGLLYRLSTALFFLSYTYFFLLDESRYANYAYLICLFSFLLIFIPAHRAFSIAAWLQPKIRSQTAPAWSLWLLRTQMGVVYFFGGIGEFASDWLHGEPMRTWLQNNHLPLVARFSQEQWAPYVGSCAILLFNLFIVPLLLWRRTRIAAFCLAVIFHLLNAMFSPGGIYPWLAIAATTLFLSPSWPRRIISIFRAADASPPQQQSEPLARGKQNFVLSLVAIYIGLQILVPLAPLLYPGGLEWTYAEHHFSWQTVPRRQSVSAFFYVTDPNNGATYQVNPEQYLDGQQIAWMAWRPDMAQQFARYLTTLTLRAGPDPLKVQVRMLVSVNGRKPQLFLDPTVDLVAEPRVLGRPRWLLHVHEPLPPPGQDFSDDLP